MCKISARYVKACRRKVRKTGGRRPGRTDGRRVGRTDGDPDGHHHTIIRPVWRRAYKNEDDKKGVSDTTQHLATVSVKIDTIQDINIHGIQSNFRLKLKQMRYKVPNTNTMNAMLWFEADVDDKSWSKCCNLSSEEDAKGHDICSQHTKEGPHHVTSVPHTDFLPDPGLAYNKKRLYKLSYLVRKMPRVMVSVASTLRRVRTMCRLFHTLIFSLTQDSPTTRKECIS